MCVDYGNLKLLSIALSNISQLSKLCSFLYGSYGFEESFKERNATTTKKTTLTVLATHHYFWAVDSSSLKCNHFTSLLFYSHSLPHCILPALQEVSMVYNEFTFPPPFSNPSFLSLSWNTTILLVAKFTFQLCENISDTVLCTHNNKFQKKTWNTNKLCDCDRSFRFVWFIRVLLQNVNTTKLSPGMSTANDADHDENNNLALPSSCFLQLRSAQPR